MNALQERVKESRQESATYKCAILPHLTVVFSNVFTWIVQYRKKEVHGTTTTGAWLTDGIVGKVGPKGPGHYVIFRPQMRVASTHVAHSTQYTRFYNRRTRWC